jgi:hypothetical protein
MIGLYVCVVLERLDRDDMRFCTDNVRYEGCHVHVPVSTVLSRSREHGDAHQIVLREVMD